MQDQDLDWMILVCPFQFGIFCDSVVYSIFNFTYAVTYCNVKT